MARFLALIVCMCGCVYVGAAVTRSLDEQLETVLNQVKAAEKQSKVMKNDMHQAVDASKTDTDVAKVHVHNSDAQRKTGVTNTHRANRNMKAVQGYLHRSETVWKQNNLGNLWQNLCNVMSLGTQQVVAKFLPGFAKGAEVIVSALQTLWQGLSLVATTVVHAISTAASWIASGASAIWNAFTSIFFIAADYTVTLTEEAASGISTMALLSPEKVMELITIEVDEADLELAIAPTPQAPSGSIATRVCAAMLAFAVATLLSRVIWMRVRKSSSAAKEPLMATSA